MTAQRDPRYFAKTSSVRTGFAIWRVLLCAVLFMASACHQIGIEAPAVSESSAEAFSATKPPVSLDGAPQPQKHAVVPPPAPANPEIQPQVVVEVAELHEEGTDDAGAITESRSDSEVLASISPSLLPPKPELQPSSLIGARKEDLIARFGAPGLLRREPPAEFWQFAGDGCVLHVYLYENTVDRLYQVTHVELLPRGEIEVIPPHCFRRLFRDKPRSSG